NIVDAPDGEDAWDKIQRALSEKNPFQLIISDWNMPKMKGVDVLTRVRALPQIASTPFILLTAEAERDQVAVAIQPVVSGYLLKPFTKEQLQTTLAATYRKQSKAA